MVAKKFELFMCCLGNGITVCNKAVIENGDYKKIAHISNAGNIKFYVQESYIPATEMDKIKRTASGDSKNFKKRFEALPDIKQYDIILNNIPMEKFMEFVRIKKPLAEKLPVMRDYYYTIA